LKDWFSIDSPGSGKGIPAHARAIQPDFMVKQDLADGRLIHALPQWLLPDGGIYAVFPSTRFRAPRVEMFIELLSSMIKGSEPTRVRATSARLSIR
jgi:DNA-binding transcriptional LysR family regulator